MGMVLVAVWFGISFWSEKKQVCSFVDNPTQKEIDTKLDQIMKCHGRTTEKMMFACRIIRDMLSVDLTERPSVEQVLEKVEEVQGTQEKEGEEVRKVNICTRIQSIFCQ